MSIDIIRINLYNWEFEVLSKGRSLRHAYLDKVERTGFRQVYINRNSNDYMPTIHVYADNTGIKRAEIQVCPSKLLYGTNIYETKEEDLECFLSLLVEKLEYAGILTDESVLRNHYLSGWDVNKPILLPFTSSVLRLICTHNIPQPAKSRKGYSAYETSDGWCVHFNFQHKGIKMYDKTAEAMKWDGMPTDLSQLFKQNGYCLLNLEYAMNDKKAIDEELKLIKSYLPNTLETAFDRETCSKILQYRTIEVLEGFFTISNDMVKHLASVEQFCDMHKQYNGLQKRNALFGAVCKFNTLGYSDYCKYLKQHYSLKEVRNNLNLLKKLNLSRMPEERLFKDTILESLYSDDYVTKDSIIETLNRYKSNNFIPTKTPVIQETENLEGVDNEN
ncbi:MAG: hypothetical protein IKP23_02625 [Elusimicrobiaceae bacterium]|nr:hypothetical protein [Elusimicrobiaceae bacterium]